MRFTTALVLVATPLFACAHPLKVTRAISDATVTVLKFAELLEQLETEFYKQALAKFKPEDFTAAGFTVPDVAIQGFQDILSHESSHVAVLDQALADNGASPISGCSFNFDPVLTDVATMAAVARVVEHVGVAAYLGGADIIDDKNFLAAAATILTVEARHQSFLNIVGGATAVPQAFDVALSPFDVLSIAGAFVTGCDPVQALGLPGAANPPLAITNQGVVAAGTRLEFSSPALNSTSEASASCQMMVGGQATSLSFPINECIVPEGIDGPVWIWLTKDTQPLAADIHVRNGASILAGPTAAFIDSKSNALGALIRNGSGFNSSETISPSQATEILSSASQTATESAPATTVESSSAAPTAVSPPVNAANPPEATSSAPVPAVSVIGVGVIPASTA